MKISKNKAISIHYSVSTADDTLIDSSYDHDPLSVVQGSSYLIPGLEEALEGHEAGDTFEVTVAPEKGYGERFDDYVQTVPKEIFGDIEDLAVGAQLRATTDEGEQTVIVVDIAEDEITVDGNHPLAGMELKFNVEVLEVREATEDEVAQGQVQNKKESSGGCTDTSCCP